MQIHPVFCTAVSKDRLAAAQALACSIAAFHPGERLVVLVVDDRSGNLADNEQAIFMQPSDLPVGAGQVHELALCVGPDDVAACLVPALLQELMRRESDRPMVYLDAETVVLSSLDELGALARQSDVVLLPRSFSVPPRDGKHPNEREILALGVYDPGCIAVAHGAELFLSWWQEALGELASVEGAQPRLAQDLLDGVPLTFSVRVLEDPRYGIAYWNAHERAIQSGGDGALLVGGLPAKTVHLSGFDPATPSLFSSSLEQSPRTLLSEHPGLEKVCREWANCLQESAAKFKASSFSVLADGVLVDERMRRLVRRSRRNEGIGGEDIPDPFFSGSLSGFYRWLASPERNDPLVPLLPRYLHEIAADRFDVQWTFPRVGTVDAPRFREWVERHGLDEEDVPSGLRAALAKSDWWKAPGGVAAAAPSELRPGVTFAGYLGSSIGVGEAGRLVVGAISRSGREVDPIATGQLIRHDYDNVPIARRETNIVWMNADQLPGFASIVGSDFFEGRYTVGGWVWETEHLPKEMTESADLVDELWVPSAFVRDAVEPVVDRPVFVFPYPVTEPERLASFNRASFRVPAGFMFLNMFDFLSSMHRKNALGLVSAYRAVFDPGDGAVLVLKTVNGEKRLADLEQLRLATVDRRDIVVLNQRMEAASRGALLGECDCFVSLHRSEGFGLTLAESMLLAKPVVATGYSGNLDFMDETCSYLVPATRVLVGSGVDPYPADDSWGEPDLDISSEILRRIFHDRTEASSMGERGRLRANDFFRAENSSRFLESRFSEIERRRRSGYVSTVARAARDRI